MLIGIIISNNKNIQKAENKKLKYLLKYILKSKLLNNVYQEIIIKS